MYQITKEDFAKKLRQKFPQDDFTVIAFSGATKPTTIHCNKCKQDYTYKRGTTLYSSNRKYFCLFCHCDIIQDIYQACHEHNLSIVSNPHNTTDPWVFHCNICGDTFSRIVYHWETKQCPKCLAKNKAFILQDKWQKIVDDICGVNEFTILENTNADHFLVKHKCGFIRKTQSGAFFRSPWCPRCKGTMSKGERKILDYLVKNNIQYQSQKKIPGSRQSFDFFVFPNLAIEFNGKQHYEPIEIFGGETRFQEQIEYDRKKAEYCKNNNLTLLIISYKEYEKIDTILDDFFRKFNDQSQDVRKD